MMAAIVIATAGVVVMSYKPGGMAGGIRPTLIGLASGAHVRALGHRLSRRDPHRQPSDFVMAATFTLALGLVLQAALLTALSRAARPRGAQARSSRNGGRSLFAGLMGAFASQFWFLAFALATAASVRTLALVEVLFAQAISASSSDKRPVRAKASASR